MLPVVGFFVFLNIADEGLRFSILLGECPVVRDGGLDPYLARFAKNLGKQSKMFHQLFFQIGYLGLCCNLQCTRAMNGSARAYIFLRIYDVFFSRSGKFFMWLGEKLNFQIWKQIGEILLNLSDGLIVFNRYFHNSKINQEMKVMEPCCGMPGIWNAPF